MSRPRLGNLIAVSVLVTLVLFLVKAERMARTGSRPALPDHSAGAWTELEQVHHALRAPNGWRRRAPSEGEVAEFRSELRESAVSIADRAREFIQRFPDHENVGDARVMVVTSLLRAVAAGDAGAERQIGSYVSQVLRASDVPETERIDVLLCSGYTALYRKLGMRLFIEGRGKFEEEFEAADIENLRAALRQFPTSSKIYTRLINIAQRSTGDRQRGLCREVVDAPGAPPDAKRLAEHMLRGTKPYEIGKPLDIRFTALDGRVVDLADLKGSVVLIEFWSTTCGPCIARIPALKAAFERLHGRGFEILGIALDDKESVVRRFVKEHGLPWPQHFDGKGWENQFAARYGVSSLPTLWLVDRRGALRDVAADQDFERQVEALLGEVAPASE